MLRCHGENFVPMELLMVALFVLVLLLRCALAYRFVEAPMQRRGRRLAQRPDARFGNDVVWRLPSSAAQ
jgi:peptidoglycan/LPS O-acetylase OafA/YrhL